MPSEWLTDDYDRKEMINKYHSDYKNLESTMLRLKANADSLKNDLTDVTNSDLFTSEEEASIGTELTALKAKIIAFVNTF